jgi:DNA-binding XRE family transcriptional regulator/phage-related protein
MKYFETRFLAQADEFISKLAPKTIKKIIYNIDLAEQTNDPKLLKKLHNDIWEFRTKYAGLQIRLLAFWDKTDNKETLVVATHGFIKKVIKFPKTKLTVQTDYEIIISATKRKNKDMATKEIKAYSLAEMKDKYIGKVGTADRDEYEYELRMDVLGKMIKAARQERNLTQEELGRLIGVQKAQISKLESSANSATIDTIIKVFRALKAEINFNVKLEDNFVKLA